MKSLYELVEFFADGSSLVRHTGSRRVCEWMAVEFARCGFRVAVRRAAA